ncbi:hypothetical protein CC86DRAFT_161571 [Ophiobolus disseminans]|uniref:Uncharacterized protein n=1 Tax=Ophiobolus disseminans TaxID=1469910 RepID=A0A6A7AAU5_9PLEO|nr:hypothetical protein CC86DRAFT_161571 [Ophiobolus disseminans]
MDEFANHMPYAYRKNINNFFGQFSGYKHPDSDDDGEPDDGFDAAVEVEEKYEEQVETVAEHLAQKIHNGEQVSTGIIMGNWTLHSPDYLNLREVQHRDIQSIIGPCDFRYWVCGSLQINNASADTSVIGTATVGKLFLNGFEDKCWHVYSNVPEMASLDAQACQAVRHMLVHKDRPESAEEVFGEREARVGVLFFGEGCLKMKVPGIHLGGKEQWNRWITLYGVREVVEARVGGDDTL